MADEVKVVKTKGISAVWVIPLMALALAAWLVYENQQAKGLLVSIEFNSADGLVAGQTKVKLKSVNVGTVESIELGDDLNKVIVKARLQQSVKKHIDEDTKFWVEKARVDMGGISGLGTLLSGAYIGVDTGIEEGDEKTNFIGLEKPPLLSDDIEGTKVSLVAQKVDGLTQGAPVYYRSVKVGTIESVALSDNINFIDVKAYIYSPYDELINDSTVFWRVSGVEAKLSTQGIDFAINSLQALITGAIAFESQRGIATEDIGEMRSSYVLYDSFEETSDTAIYEKEYFVLYFDQNIRGLNVGAEVDFRGVTVGNVISIDTELVDGIVKFPIKIEIEPQRIGIPANAEQTSEESKQIYQRMIDRGLRAKLDVGNILTGQLLVSLDVFPTEENVALEYYENLPIIPTIAGGVDAITSNINSLLVKLNGLNLEEWNVKIDNILGDVETLVSSGGNEAQTTLKNLNETIVNANLMLQSFSEGSATRYDIDETLKSIKEAADSVKELSDTINQKPNSVIFGKE